MNRELTRLQDEEIADQHDRMVGLVAAISGGMAVVTLAVLVWLINF